MRICRNEFRKPVGPFNDRDAVAKKIVVQTEPLSRLSIFDSKKIKMIDGEPAPGIFVDEGKCRAGRSGGCADASDQTFDELGFTAAELAFEREDVTRFNISGELTAERFSFAGAIGNECSHGAEVEG